MGRDVIVACDFASAEQTYAFLDRFAEEPQKPFVKIGMELYYAEGPAIVREIKRRGHRIFLDLKLHDIPNTVKKAMKVLARLDVDIVNVHAAGTAAMMRAALEGLEEGAEEQTQDRSATAESMGLGMAKDLSTAASAEMTMDAADIEKTMDAADIEKAMDAANIEKVMEDANAEKAILLSKEKQTGSINRKRPLLIAVTQLTSTDQESLEKELLIERPMPEVVMSYARNAQDAGLDGVVCSPLEAEAVHQACGARFLTVTPGIRFADGEVGDQKRVMTPAAAAAAGSDYIVVGRPITAATDPVAAYRRCMMDFTA